MSKKPTDAPFPEGAASASWPHWRRSTRCEHANCVEVASSGGSVYVRDSKDPDGPTLRFEKIAWSTFIDSL
jgi:hypothetical protein